MDKNVGGVDLEELMRAREELDRERGVETDPDMYNDYGKDHSEPVVSEERPEEVVQEEPQGYNYNQETNEAYSNDGRTVDGDGDGYAVRPGDNEYGWVAEEDTPEVKQEEPQSFADAFENIGYVALAEGLGIISGDGSGLLNPNKELTRIEAVCMVLNLASIKIR